MTEPQAIKRHEPLVRIVRRAEMPAGRVALLAGLSLVLGILVGALFILLLGYNPRRCTPPSSRALSAASWRCRAR